MAKEITIDISPAGSASIDVKGFTGKGCTKATEQLEMVLGGTGGKKRKEKPEYYAPTGTKTGTKLTF